MSSAYNIIQQPLNEEPNLLRSLLLVKQKPESSVQTTVWKKDNYISWCEQPARVMALASWAGLVLRAMDGLRRNGNELMSTAGRRRSVLLVAKACTPTVCIRKHATGIRRFNPQEIWGNYSAT